MVAGVQGRIKEMKTFYAKRKTKKEILALSNDAKSLHTEVGKFSARLKSLAAFTAKLESHLEQWQSNRPKPK